jgi:hypothetical protein
MSKPVLVRVGCVSTIGTTKSHANFAIRERVKEWQDRGSPLFGFDSPTHGSAAPPSEPHARPATKTLSDDNRITHPQLPAKGREPDRSPAVAQEESERPIVESVDDARKLIVEMEALTSSKTAEEQKLWRDKIEEMKTAIEKVPQ